MWLCEYDGNDVCNDVIVNDDNDGNDDNDNDVNDENDNLPCWGGEAVRWASNQYKPFVSEPEPEDLNKIWIRFESDLNQIWIRFVSDLYQIWIRFVSDLYQSQNLKILITLTITIIAVIIMA